MSKEFTFSSGETVKIDLSKISWNEWRNLTRGTLEDEDAMIAKVCGVSKDKLLKLYDNPQPEVRLFLRAVIEAGREPLADPNSASGSTSE